MAKLLVFLPTLGQAEFWGDVVIRFKKGQPVHVVKSEEYNMDKLPLTVVRPVRATDVP